MQIKVRAKLVVNRIIRYTHPFSPFLLPIQRDAFSQSGLSAFQVCAVHRKFDHIERQSKRKTLSNMHPRCFTFFSVLEHLYTHFTDLFCVFITVQWPPWNWISLWFEYIPRIWLFCCQHFAVYWVFALNSQINCLNSKS